MLQTRGNHQFYLQLISLLTLFRMHDQREADKTVFVGNLGSSVKEEILFELFLQAGPLKRVTIAKDQEGRQRSYGFVCYKHAEAVPYAMALLNGTLLCGRQIKLQYGSGSSHQDGGSGPQVTEDDREDPPHNTSRSARSEVSESQCPPDTPVFFFSGHPDRSFLHQDNFHWKKTQSTNTVAQHTYNPLQYPLSTPPPQLLYFAPPSGVSVPLPAPVYPPWTPAAYSQPQCPDHSLLPKGKPHPGAEDSGKPRKHRKSRESRRSARGRRAGSKKKLTHAH